MGPVFWEESLAIGGLESTNERTHSNVEPHDVDDCFSFYSLKRVIRFLGKLPLVFDSHVDDFRDTLL